MRRHISLPLALVFALVAALNVAPLLAMQGSDECLASQDEADQLELDFKLDCDSTFSEGLTITPQPETGSPPYRFYEVQFDEVGAYIPERFTSEAMVVKILDGIFAFRVQGPGVIVDPAVGPGGRLLEKFTADLSIPLGENPDEVNLVTPTSLDIRRAYTLADPAEDFACDVNLPDGRTVCLLDEDVFDQGDTFVRLEPGDTVYLPNNSTCFLCNTNRINPDGTEVTPPAGDIPARVLIWSSTTGFNGSLEDPQIAAVDPQQDQLHSTAAWMLNPGSRCN